MTDDLSTIMKNRLNVEKRTTGQLDSKKDNYRDIDLLYKDLSDLVNDKFRLWYCKQFNVLGRERVLRIASEARADAQVDKRKLFSSKLKKEVKLLTEQPKK